MADGKLNIGSTEDFSMEDSSEIEAFLNGDTDIKKIEPKKEEKSNPKAPVKKVSKKTDQDEEQEDTEEEDQEDQEEGIDVLDALSSDEESDEQQDEPKEKPKKKEAKAEDDESPEENSFEVISRQMYDAGIFTQDEDEDEVVLAKSPEELLALFQANSQKSALRQLDSFLRSRGDDRMDLFEAIFVNGVDPKEYIPVYNRVQDFEGLDISQEENQERVVREYYKRLNWKEDAIAKKVQKLKDYGDLEEEAGVMHPQLVEQDKDALEQQKLQKQQEEQTKKAGKIAFQQGVQKTLVEAIKAKDLGGIPITEAKAKEVMVYLVQPKYRLPNGEEISEFDKYLLESKKPENIKDRVLFAYLKLNGFDFSKIEKKAISTKTNELFAGLQKKAVKSKNEKVTQGNDDFWSPLK